MEPSIDQLLLRSITEPLSPGEQAQLEEALQRSPALRRHREQLLRTRDLVQGARPDPRPDFAAQVLRRLQKGRKEAALVVRLYPRVAAACLVALAALSLYLYFEAGSLSGEALMGLQDLSLEEAVALTEY